jgi:hypothetical protein
MVPHGSARTLIPSIALLAIALVLAACGSSQASQRPSTTPHAPPPSPSASAMPSASASASAEPSPSEASCEAVDVNATITRWEGAAGSRIAWVDVDNASADECTLGAPTSAKLMDSLGQDLVTTTGSAPVGQDVPLGADQTARLLVQITNWCGAAPSKPVSVDLTLSTGATFVVEPATGVTFDPPPCNGPAQPATMDIQADGWTPATATSSRDLLNPRAGAV